MTETNKEQTPAHDCAVEIAKALNAALNKHEPNSPEYLGKWEDLPNEDRAVIIAAVKDLPEIIIQHGSEHFKAWLAAQFSTSSGWRKWLFGIACASVGAAVLYFFPSCTPMTPEQVRQIDAAHAIMHRVTKTDCTLCAPVAVTPNGK